MEDEKEPEGEEKGRKVSRRSFLKTAAVGAAAVGVMAAASPALASSAEAILPGASDVGAWEGRGPVVMYVRDVRKGKVSIMVGTKEIVRKDPRLVARLLRMAGE